MTRESKDPGKVRILTSGSGFRFAYLGSGSRGNAALIRTPDTCVMLDCGFSARETETRLERLDTSPGDLRAILVTHEHSDHISGVARFARRYGLPVWMTPGTRAAVPGSEFADIRLVNCHRSFTIGSLSIEPIPVPHDAREPCQYIFSDSLRRLAILTDTGHVTPYIRHRLDSVDTLAVECNHDAGMLADGPYPQPLKARIGGQLGHLSNLQAAELVAGMNPDRIGRVVAVHLSETNNTPAHVRHSLRSAGVTDDRMSIACQHSGLAWLDV